MHFKPVYQKLLKAEEYKAWRKDHLQFTLAHVFYLNDESNKDIWHIGFFDSISDTITTFVMKEESIRIVPTEDVFKEEKVLVKELEVEKVRLEFDEALEKAKEFQKREYGNEPILKEILILQHTEQGQVYNTTFLLSSFKTLNIKIDAATGAVISHQKENFISR